MGFWVAAAAAIGGALIANEGSKKASKAQRQGLDKAEEARAQAQEQALAALAAGQEAQANAILEAAEMSIQQRERFFQIAKGYLEPFVKSGESALPEIQAMLGIKGQFDPNYITSRPDYKFVQKETQDAVQRSAAAQGSLLSGETLMSIQDRAGGIASQEFGRHYDRLMGLAGIGVNAAGNLASGAISTGSGIAGDYGRQGMQLSAVYDPGKEMALTSDYGTDLANLALGQGNNRASLISNTYNNYAQALSSIGSMYGYSQGYGGGGAGYNSGYGKRGTTVGGSGTPWLNN